MGEHQTGRLLNEHEVAKLLGVSVSTIRRFRILRRPPHYVKIGASVRYEREEVESFILASGSKSPVKKSKLQKESKTPAAHDGNPYAEIKREILCLNNKIDKWLKSQDRSLTVNSSIKNRLSEQVERLKKQVEKSDQFLCACKKEAWRLSQESEGRLQQFTGQQRLVEQFRIALRLVLNDPEFPVPYAFRYVTEESRAKAREYMVDNGVVLDGPAATSPVPDPPSPPPPPEPPARG